MFGNRQAGTLQLRLAVNKFQVLFLFYHYYFFVGVGDNDVDGGDKCQTDKSRVGLQE